MRRNPLGALLQGGFVNNRDVSQGVKGSPNLLSAGGAGSPGGGREVAEQPEQWSLCGWLRVGCGAERIHASVATWEGLRCPGRPRGKGTGVMHPHPRSPSWKLRIKAQGPFSGDLDWKRPVLSGPTAPMYGQGGRSPAHGVPRYVCVGVGMVVCP